MPLNEPPHENFLRTPLDTAVHNCKNIRLRVKTRE